MTSNTSDVRADVVVGIDTHKESHCACALNGVGAEFGRLRITATMAGYEELVRWVHDLGDDARFGVEGTGSYGKALARYLGRQGYEVVEVNRPSKQERRRRGKDDFIDAKLAAEAVLSGRATAKGKSGDGVVEAIRLVKIARDGAIKSRSETMNQLKAVLVTAEDELRSTLEAMTDGRLIAACAELAEIDPKTPDSAARYSLGRLAGRWLALNVEVRGHDQHLDRLTAQAAPQLREQPGIGPQVVSDLLLTVGDNPHRIRSEASFAKLCGVCPIPASSGNTERHRLNRGGDRRANASLHRVVATRLRWDERTQLYVARRRQEGKTKREAIRCLKRYIAREVFQQLVSRSESGQALRNEPELNTPGSPNKNLPSCASKDEVAMQTAEPPKMAALPVFPSPYGTCQETAGDARVYAQNCRQGREQSFDNA